MQRLTFYLIVVSFASVCPLTCYLRPTPTSYSSISYASSKSAPQQGPLLGALRRSRVLVGSRGEVQVEVAGDGEGRHRREGGEALLEDGVSLAVCCPPRDPQPGLLINALLGRDTFVI